MTKINYPNENAFSLKIDSFINGINTKKDNQLTNMNYATSLYNFSFEDGALKNGLGFNELIKTICSKEEAETILKDLKAIGSIEKIFHFYLFNQETNIRDDKLIFVNYEQKFYYIDLYSTSKKLNILRNMDFIKTPNAVRYRLNNEDVMIFTSEEDNMVVWNGYDEPYSVLDSPNISSMAIHYERLFATVDKEKNSIWFSDDLDPTNWSVSLNEAGFIELLDERGPLLKVVSFCDYIYIFRKYGISRLSGYGSQETFSVSNLFVSSGEIYSDSVCVCGDEIIFLASDGLYKFDGVNTTKILTNIENNLKNISNQKISSCYYNGSYYLACNFNTFENSNSPDFNLNYSNTILEIDISTHKLKNICNGINIKYITSFTTDKISGVIALTRENELLGFEPTIISGSGKYINKPLHKVWLSPTSGINNTYMQKTLKRINLQSLGNLSLTIYHDNHETTFNMFGSEKPISIRTNLPFNLFSFKIESEDSICEIKNLEFEFVSAKKII